MSLIRTPKEEGHYTLKRVKRLPKKGNYNWLYALRTTNLDRLYRYLQDGEYEEILLGGGGLTSVEAGTDISVDSTDPKKPVVSLSGVFVRSIIAGDDVTIDSTDPDNPIVNFVGRTFNSVIAGDDVSIDNTDPDNPVISLDKDFVEEIVPGMNVSVDNTNPRRPIVNAIAGITSVQAGPNITVDNTNPNSPIISSTGGAGNTGIESIVPGANVAVDNTDALNPVISVQGITDTNDFITGANLSAATLDITGTGLSGASVDLSSLLGVESVSAGTNITVDNTDPSNPIINSTATGAGGGLQSVVAGTNITVDNTDPNNPVINSTATGGGLQSVQGGLYTTVSNTDPQNPVVNVDSVKSTFNVSVQDSSGGATYTIANQDNKAVRIGDIIYVTIDISGINSTGTPTGSLRVLHPFGNPAQESSLDVIDFVGSDIPNSDVNMLKSYCLGVFSAIFFKTATGSTTPAANITNGAMRLMGVIIPQ